ncbi:hypothetical protein BGZ82_008994 [Podila clonocystis]|nr:hypothetical protein BGZ82_008994 [Podila clonocystis]
MVISKDDFKELDQRDCVRMQMPYQVVVGSNDRHGPLLKLSEGHGACIKLYSVELHSSPSTLDQSCVKPIWPSVPRKSFGVLHPLKRDDLWDLREAASHKSIPWPSRLVASRSIPWTRSEDEPSGVQDDAVLLQEDLKRDGDPPGNDLYSNEDPVTKEYTKEARQYPNLDVALSWDATQVAVFCIRRIQLGGCENFQLYSYDPSGVPTQTNHTPPQLPKSTSDTRFVNPKCFSGYGKFISSGANERFITCNGQNVVLYSVTGDWERLYSVQLSNEPVLRAADFLIRSAYGEWFVWPSGNTAFVWHLKTGSLMSSIGMRSKVYESEFLASDDKTIAFRANTTVALFSAVTGQELGRWDSEWFSSSIGSDLSQSPIEMRWMCPANINGLIRAMAVCYLPSFLAETGCLVQKFDSNYKVHATGIQGPTIVTRCHGAMLDIQHLEDIALRTDGTDLTTCTPDCYLVPHDSRDYATHAPFEVVCTQTQEHRLDVIVTNNDHPGPVLSIDNVKNYTLLEKQWQVISYSDNMLSIWGLPKREGENFVLLLHWVDLKILVFNEDESMVSRDELVVSLLTCPKHESEIELKWKLGTRSAAISRLYDDCNVDYFLAGIENLFKNLGKSSEIFTSATIRYIGPHINRRFVTGENSTTSVMSILCKMICNPQSEKSLDKYRVFTQSVLESLDVRWMPESSYTDGENPLSILLEGATTQPLCMPELNQLHPELALKICQQSTYLRVSDRHVVIDNHAVVNIPSVRRLWSNWESPIYKCRNPLLQFRFSPNPPEPMNAYFTERVFFAPFILLWSVTTPPEDCSLDFVQSNLPPLPRWKIFFHLVLHQFKPNSHIYVRPHYYDLEKLNSPAIEALIQYKWRKFAYALWLTRFSVQCLLEYFNYRALKNARNLDVYIKVVVPALHYFGSFYNILDLAAFLVPLATSINQMINISQKNENGATWDLSFSIVIIFFHMISELRVLEGVGKYVAIAIRVLGEIREFFGIFALGILSFTIAIQHVLRGRAVGELAGCSSDSNFPCNFFEAITSTFFIMGGRYDPVSKELDASASGVLDAPLQIMMLVYFLFTVVLMLNVLIALINIGFIKGEVIARLLVLENRLRYVEIAEEMSYHIPGFRESSNWFPREIYYTATGAQVSEYEDKVLKKNGEIEDIIEKRIQDALKNQLSQHQKNSDNSMNSQFEKLMIAITKENPAKSDESGPEATEESTASSGERDDEEQDEDMAEDEDEENMGDWDEEEDDELAVAGEAMALAVTSNTSAGPSSSNEAHQEEEVISGKDEEKQDETELQQLRAQVGDLVKQQAELVQQQEDSRKHSLKLENMLAQVLQTLKKEH